LSDGSKSEMHMCVAQAAGEGSKVETSFHTFYRTYLALVDCEVWSGIVFWVHVGGRNATVEVEKNRGGKPSNLADSRQSISAPGQLPTEPAVADPGYLRGGIWLFV
jgi:hypothetical protein